MRRLPHGERRGKIVHSAMGVFARNGFGGTRTRELARAAGVSEALLFKFFPTKRALQKAIIEERIRQVGQPLPPDMADTSPQDALTALAARYIALVDRDPSFMRLLLFSGLEGEPLAPMFFRRRIAQSIETLTRVFRAWMRKGLVRRTLDARLAAWSFNAAIFQLMMFRHIFGWRHLEDRPGDLPRKIVDIFFRGLRP